MRKVICVEGKEFQGRKTIIVPGAIYMEDDDRVPITTGAGHDRIIGYAKNLQRDISTGEVSMDLFINPQFHVNLDEFEATVSLHPFMAAKGKDDEELTLINAGRLREVFLTWDRPPAVPEGTT